MIHKYKVDNEYIVLDVDSGSVHLIDKIVYDILDYYKTHKKADIIQLLKCFYSEEEISEAYDEISYLVSAGELYTNEDYEDDPYYKARTPVIKAMCLHIAHDCNIRCKYCFASQGDFKGDRSLMSFDVGKKALDFLIANSGNRRNLEVDFFGGEPLLNFEVVKKLVEYGRKEEKKYNKNFRFTLTTNGVLLSEDKMDFINKNMDNVVLSIDGRKEINDKMRYFVNSSGTYDVIVPKFKKFVDKREHKSYYVRGTFTSYNKDFSKDVLHLRDLGFKSISLEPVIGNKGEDYTFSNEDIDFLLNEYEKLAKEMLKARKTDKNFNFFHFNIDLTQGPCLIKKLSGCGAGTEYVAITPFGDIYPCHQFVGDEKYKLGSVYEEHFNNRLKDMFLGANIFNKGKCQECFAKYYCSGGCHANAITFNEDILEPYEVNCILERKRIELGIYIQAKLMEEDNDFIVYG